jgi:hypothetical protein
MPWPYASHNGSSFVLAYNYANNGATYTYLTGIPNPIDSPGVLRYYTGNTDYKYFSVDSSSVPSTGTYTFSYYARLVSGPTETSNIGNSQLWRANGSDRSVSGDWNPTYTKNWTRYVTTGPMEANTILNYFPVHSNSITGGYTIDFCGFQLEGPRSTATSFGVGTRSNTQAILDLTGNNTWTVNNLTYNTNGTFSFNGSSSWIESSTSSVFDSQNITMESWHKPTTLNQAGFLFEKGQVNTQYSNFYASDGTFIFRTIGLSPQDFTFAASTYIRAYQWNHVVCTVGGGTKTVYINGVQRYQQTGVTGTMPTGQTNQYVGKYGSGGNNYPFSGDIAISKVYNRVLSAAEVLQNYNALAERFFGYQTLTYTTTGGNLTITGNGTPEVSMFKTSGSGAWDNQVYSTEAFTAPCTIEFTKPAGVEDNSLSYAMIGWNTDPTTNASYTSIDHAAYPYAQNTYTVWNNGSAQSGLGTWDTAKRFYIVYDTDGYIRHYNGSKLLYTSSFYGTGNTVYVDSSFSSVSSTFGGFTNVKVCRRAWNGYTYV